MGCSIKLGTGDPLQVSRTRHPGPSPTMMQARSAIVKIHRVLLLLPILLATQARADAYTDVEQLLATQQFADALTKTDIYLASKPADLQMRFLKGVIESRLQRLDAAQTTFTRLTEDYPELPEPYNNLAVLYAQQKQYDKARTALEMAIRTHPSYAIAYENLGDIYAKLASQAYDKALQLDNSNAATQNKLALIRDLITTSSKPGSKPQATAQAAAPSTPAATKPVAPAAPTASIVSSTPGAASSSTAAPAKPLAAAPAATPAAPARVDSANDDVAKAIAAWASAWSRKDMRAYLGAYAGDFNTPKGVSRKVWENEREDRIAGKPGKISVTYDTPQIVVNGDKATAKFRQHYQASNLSSSTTKTLVLVRSGNKWLIKEENSR